LNFNRRRRVRCLAFAGTTIVVGLMWRLVPLGLPPFWFKYGGSALWAAMVYWIAAAALPNQRPVKVAAIACCVATIVELSRLFHTPATDAFRISLAGRLLLGRFFSVWDIVAYCVAIGMVAVADQAMTRTTGSR